MQELTELLEEGKSPYHVAAIAAARLCKAGYEELEYREEWNLKAGGRYFIRPYASMLIAFMIPQNLQRHTPVRIMLAHTDFPCFKVKPKASMTGKGYMQLNVEPYGGMLKGTWFDRPLGLYGKAALQSENLYHPAVRLFESEKAVAVIPSLALHLRKGAEQRTEYDMQQELIPLLGMLKEQMEKDNFLIKYLTKRLCVEQEALLDYDLFITNMDKPEIIGLEGEFISAPRIDNLASVSAVIEAMTSCSVTAEAADRQDVHNSLVIAGLFDHEEIGSRSKQGADSTLLSMVIEKIGAAFGMDTAALHDMTAGGFLLSVDGAHALHPNYVNSSDVTNDVLLGGGIVIKSSASQRYLSDSEAAAVVEAICRNAHIPYQKQANRSGMPGGQTLGPIAVSYLPMAGADIGIPMLAMHSARELAAVSDYEKLVEFLTVYITGQKKLSAAENKS